MPEIIWTAPALADLNAIAEYIALDNPGAAARWLAKVFNRLEQLASRPLGGGRVPELPRSRYRPLVQSPCRVFYRLNGVNIIVPYVMRNERHLQPRLLKSRK